jgi:hypothetical protein
MKICYKKLLIKENYKIQIIIVNIIQLLLKKN